MPRGPVRLIPGLWAALVLYDRAIFLPGLANGRHEKRLKLGTVAFITLHMPCERVMAGFGL